MNAVAADASAPLRRAVYAILIAVGAAGVAGRIAAVDSVDVAAYENFLKRSGREDWQRRFPFLSANDRSRWLTVRALVERGTYSIDGLIDEPNWHSIDIVKHDGHGNAAPAANEGHLYSSKPPLLATLIAGEYWLIYNITGYSLGDHPHLLGRIMLATINIPALLVMWILLARHVERYGRTDFGRVFVVAAGVFGTLLTTLAVALNNHLIAAAAAMVALDAVVRIVYEDDVRLRRFLQAGLAAAFAAANELPALSFCVLVGAALLWRFPRPTLTAFVPGALVVAAAALGTNYAAHGTIAPAYGHRNEGNNWYDFDYMRHGTAYFSYWSKRNPGRSDVDQGEPSPAVYAFHATIGHHGIFLLTPMWLLAFVGMAQAARRDASLRALVAGIALVTAVCLTFYLSRPQIDRNYGGTTSGFRWVFWFAPLWLVAMLPAADACARNRFCRALACILLAGSVFSVVFPTWNPWTHPWAMQFYEYMDWPILSE